MSTVLVTGGSGFIGSSLCEALVTRGDRVIAYDNLSSGSKANLSSIRKKKGEFEFVGGDVKSRRDLRKVLRGVDTIFHFAANPEVRLDRANPQTCFEENVVSTQAVLETARVSPSIKIVFASTSTVYGEANVRPTPEDYAPMVPISIYGACKLASEALIVAYAKTYRFDAVILRFANVIGPRSTHGVVPDFVNKLQSNPRVLEILGDGTQTKSYLHVEDCVSGIIAATDYSKGTSFYNVGSEDQIGIRQVADIICHETGTTPRYSYTGGVDGGRGWLGDVKNMLLDTKKLQSLGWRAKYSSAEAVRTTVRGILESRVVRGRHSQSK